MMLEAQSRQKAFFTIGEWNERQVHVTRRVYDRAVGTDPDYTGFNGADMRAAALIDSFTEALFPQLRQNPDAKSLLFSHKVEDRGWNGDPEKIEDQRLALVATISGRSVTIDFNVRRVAYDKADESRWLQLCSAAKRRSSRDIYSPHIPNMFSMPK